MLPSRRIPAPRRRARGENVSWSGTACGPWRSRPRTSARFRRCPAPYEDSAAQAGTRLAAAYRERHPGVHIRIREADLTDPTTGLRADLVDVALTRAPFDETGITARILRSDPVGVVLRTDDPLADREILHMDDLTGRRW